MFNRLLSIAVLLFVICQSAVWASGDMDAGIASFGKHDYRAALTHFTAALKADPNDCDALYYEAITLHKLNEMNLAKQAYATIILRYPGTQAARNSQAALNYLNPAYLKKFQQQVASASDGSVSMPRRSNVAGYGASSESATSLSNLPDQVRIPYRKQGNNLVINAFINNHPLEMYFDSGAELTVVRKSQLGSLGLRDPRGAPTGQTYGVGDGGAQGTWMIKTDIKVGQIEHSNFPIAVQEDAGNMGPSYPLLGETFFRGFSYKVMPIDESQGSIFFQKKGANSSIAQDSGTIPYKDLGTDMIVTVQVNGRTVPMIFDTGAEGCCFTWHQWVNEMKMSVPEDATDARNSGIAGSTRSKHFNVDTMRLGSITKHDVPIDVIENSNIPYPLLGNSFFGDLHIDVDNSSHLIRVRR